MVKMFKSARFAGACLAVFTSFLLPTAAPAAGAAPAAVEAPDRLPGLWEQFDDKTGKLQGLVRISLTPAGTYKGVVEKIIPEPGEDPNPKCEQCKDARRNQPVLGMEIISGLKRNGDDSYGDGEILDPDEGDVYRVKITVLEQGAKLDVRGFIGISLFGRSQIWRRAKAQN